MPNSEDYTVVWVGICRRLDETEIAQAQSGTHPLIQSAQSVGLRHWFDTFGTTPQGEPESFLLAGERLDLLGYKEGRSAYSISRERLATKLEEIDAALARAGLEGRAELHVMLRIQD